MLRFSMLTLLACALLFFLGGTLLPTGCSRADITIITETEERAFQRGKQFQREGRHQEALAAFLRVIDERPDAAESHLEAGIIYLQELTEPILAIYHFSRFLERRPNSPQAALVRGLIEQGRRTFASQIPGQPFADEFDRLDLLEMLEESRRDNARLRQELLEAQNRVARLEDRLSQVARGLTPGQTQPPSPNQAQMRQPGPTPPPAVTSNQQGQSAPRTYTVAPGDTLSRISATVFGTPARWREIFEANRNILNSPDDLRVGQVLRIPPA
jgi:tetratricopeptide (TPR) repeat protein